MTPETVQLLATSLCALSMVAFGGIALVASLQGASASAVHQRLKTYVGPMVPGSENDASLLRSRPQELSGNFRTRILIPAFNRVAGILGNVNPSAATSQLRDQLAQAGNPLGMGPREFYGLQVAFMALGTWLAYRLMRNGFGAGSAQAGLNPLVSATAAVLVLLLCYFLPKVWLRHRASRRQNTIAKGLPDALDMLSVCVEAGLGFDQALQRVSEHWNTPLGAEFGRVVAEIGMGVPRRDALRSLVDRVGIRELASFVAVILQSDQLGMSIKDTLQAQAKQMRIERRFRAQEQARKMPLKMLFPLTLFIFPAMFAVILGPSIPVLTEFFRTLNP